MNEPTWIGRALNGRYQIEALIGQGGMSAVYKATDPNLRRVVAVKLIHSHLSQDGEFVRRFEEEAAAVARLRHANIIQVYDFNHDNNTYYIVFEFIPGESLQQWLKRLDAEGRKMGVEDAMRYTATIAEALDYAHQQGLIHRDIKPGNVMINVQRQPILMDFGIAKIVGGTQHTATGAVLGTARYMSPEQIKGERVDARTDIYALGVMLFEIISGRAPYEADSAMTVMMMHVQDPVPDINSLRPTVPPALGAVIQKTLAKDPRQRYQTAGELAADLRAILDGKAAPGTAVPLPDYQAPTPQPTRQDPTSYPTAAPTVVPTATYDPTIAPQAPQQTPPAPAPSGLTSKRNMVIGGVGLLVVLVLAIVGLMSLFGGGDDGNGGQTAAATQQPATATATAAIAVIDDPTTTSTATPTAKPVASSTPRPTATPLPSVRITDIRIENELYILDYAASGFTQNMEGFHVHFFFDTVSPRDAGAGSTEIYYMFAGPAPYSEIPVSERPAGATQLCAVIAEADHLVRLESGNCIDLPAEPTATVTTSPTPVPTATSPPTATPTPSVNISNITVQNSRYVVEYSTAGFTEQLPGVHIHFFFNNVAPENAGTNGPNPGNWYLWGGPRPFNGYTVNDRPSNADRMCALIAEANHAVRLNTGNCVSLP